MTLYSHNNAYPAALPHRIILSTGQSRTDNTTFTEAEIADAGYVEAPAQPSYDAATQRLGWDGSDWTVTEIPLTELKAAKIAAVNAKLDTVLTGGFTVPSGTMNGEVLQTRDLDDRTNWLVSQASYSAAVAAGQGAVEGAKFRTADNETYVLTYAAGLEVLLAMAAWGAAAMDNSWTLKDAITAAEDAAALDLIDIDEGWSS